MNVTQVFFQQMGTVMKPESNMVIVNHDEIKDCKSYHQQAVFAFVAILALGFFCLFILITTGRMLWPTLAMAVCLVINWMNLKKTRCNIAQAVARRISPPTVNVFTGKSQPKINAPLGSMYYDTAGGEQYVMTAQGWKCLP